jgi:hypothetical protein
VITDRGEEVAELGPLSPERRAVKALAQRGLVRWSGSKPAGLSGIRIEGDSVSEAVLDARR